LLTLSLICSVIHHGIPFFGIGNKEFMAAAFFVSGHYCSKRGITFRPVAAIVMLAVVAVASCIMPMSMISLRAWGVIPYFIVAHCGIFMTMILCSQCNECLKECRLRRTIIFIGDHTLEILTWHFLSFKLVSLLVIWTESRPIEQLSWFPVIPNDLSNSNYFTPWWGVYFVVGVVVPLLITGIQEQIKLCLNRKE